MRRAHAGHDSTSSVDTELVPPETKFKAKLEHPNVVSLPESQDQEPFYARPIMNALLSSRQWQVKLRSPASLINCVLWKGLIS